MAASFALFLTLTLFLPLERLGFFHTFCDAVAGTTTAAVYIKSVAMPKGIMRAWIKNTEHEGALQQKGRQPLQSLERDEVNL